MNWRSRTQAFWVIGLIWATCLAGSGCQSTASLQTIAPDFQADNQEEVSPASLDVPVPPKDGIGKDDKVPGVEMLPGSNHELIGPIDSSPYHADKVSRKSFAFTIPTPAPRKGCKLPAPLPRELDKVAQAPYRIEPPDILEIDAIRVVPKPPYRIEPLDTLFVQASQVLPGEPVAGLVGVESDGTINFGASYGSVRVDGMTIQEAQKAIEKQFHEVGFKKAEVRVAQGQSRALQQIRGQHLVRPDGTVGLGVYGNVFVAGLTLDEAKAALEAQLSLKLLKPEISLDVFAYNSKVFYVVTSGGGLGEAVYRLPATGSETVLDAMSSIGGLPQVASLHNIWISRPSPAGSKCYQVLKVDWKAITRCGDTDTNYQILPGDRVFVDANSLVKADTFLAKLFAPLERLAGFSLLGSSVVHSIPTPINTGGNGGTGGTGGTGTGTTGF
jgi:polysaccharide biosynthesis/export protein